MQWVKIFLPIILPSPLIGVFSFYVQLGNPKVNIVVINLLFVYYLLICVFLVVAYLFEILYKKIIERDRREKLNIECLKANLSDAYKISNFIWEKTETAKWKFFIKTTRYVIGFIVALIFCILSKYVSRCEMEYQAASQGIINAASEREPYIFSKTQLDGNQNGDNSGDNDYNGQDYIQETKYETSVPNGCGMRLVEEGRYLRLSDNEKDAIFYISADILADGESAVKNEVINHLNAFRSVGLHDTVVESEQFAKDTVAYLSELERDFLNDYNSTKGLLNINDYEDWFLSAPTSEDLDSIIDGRMLCYNNNVFNAEMAFMQANSWQIYAMEYSKQGGEIDTVIYCYAKAIEWTEIGLSYSDINEQTETIYYTYLRARYKDISDYIDRNLSQIDEYKNEYEELMNIAKAIYRYMP